VWLEAVAGRKAGMTAEAEVRAGEETAGAGAMPESGVSPKDAAGEGVTSPGAREGQDAGGAPEEAQKGAFGAQAAEASPPEQEELHRKAQRFAKLLVDEIQLYNREKVEEGRQRGDLGSRLKVEIEKSRAAYEKRYGQTVVAPADYFQQELVRILANNNPALLGNENSS
jgi:hypothetical protein